MSRFAVILPAAGQSSRFGGREKKPFTSLGGRALWLRSAELFWTRDEVTRVYVVISPEDRELFEMRFRAALVFANGTVVDGGSERFESVANALAVIPDDVEFVAVHDAVRPLCPKEHIDAVFTAAKEHGAAMLAVPVADTLKRVDAAHRITETVPRAGLWAAQTPQVFRRDWLVEAYARRHEVKVPITDDAQLLEALGRTVVAVPGHSSNFKITTQDDLELAEAIVAARATKPTPVLRAFGDEAAW
ncbi:MAG: 2-C-methyl-D-erythritol 4-phosphate cytidylyltransferase [Fimbriiglobus sp.]|jgi:2-C-methyl-D-erythritol 4-phosphate cytidylyltransferase|nr:2-C-methyl-D-erythritol 4-phosphate cytidylyltransferase [Fimbriiglobus sp.]